ncbi:MAG: PP2C family protein-serine/threonine phosphatase [Gemmatimonadota bacterium]|jgi:protein phosphatase
MPTPDPNRPPHDDEIDVHGLSHVGKARKENQDHFVLATIHQRVHLLATNLEDADRIPLGDEQLAFLAMVADGVGGGHGGAEASATALAAATQYVNASVACLRGRHAEEADFTDALQQAAHKAHEAVLARREADGRAGSMATTLTLYLAVWPYTYVLQVGDSRYYLLHGGDLRQVTRDQTIAEDLLERGVLSRTQAHRSPYAHVLSSAIGSDSAMPVVTRVHSAWGDVHLICSDGLTKHVSDARIAEVLRGMTSAKQACEQLLEDALVGGGSDNVTIIVGRAVARS